MSFLSFFLADKTTGPIPKYINNGSQDDDSIDLQIRSLTYIFKRLKIYKLSSFLNKEDSRFKYIDGSTIDYNSKEYQKQDQSYNFQGFISAITNDEYRVMVDFAKNKFRSWCILPELGERTKNGQFLALLDSNGREVPNFKFILLPINGISLDFIATTLSASPLYAEHFQYITFKFRYQLALCSIKEVITDSRVQDKHKPIRITLKEHKQIIRAYFTKIAFNVQLYRIYEEYIKHLPPAPSLTKTPNSPVRIKTKPSLSNLNTSLSSLSLDHPSRSSISSTSPINKSSLSNSPTKSNSLGRSQPKLSPSKSMGNLRAPCSPSNNRLKSKPSIPKFRLGELYNPVASPQVIDENNNKSSLSSNSVDDDCLLFQGGDDFRSDIYDKCKLAILEKLKVEKMTIRA